MPQNLIIAFITIFPQIFKRRSINEKSERREYRKVMQIRTVEEDDNLTLGSGKQRSLERAGDWLSFSSDLRYSRVNHRRKSSDLVLFLYNPGYLSLNDFIAL